MIPSAMVCTGVNFPAYRLGMMEAWLTLDIKRKLNIHPRFWVKPASSRASLRTSIKWQVANDRGHII